MIKHVLYFSLLLCALCATPWRVSAQAPDGDTKPNGFRVKSKEVLTIFGDYQGQPNPLARYSLDDIYYFKVQGDQVVGCKQSPFQGEKFTKILIPGDRVNNSGPLKAIKWNNEKWHDTLEFIPACPDSFPADSPSETQVSTGQLGEAFWILTDDLTDTVKIIGRVEDKHVDQDIFEPTYIRSKWFGAIMGVPFKYRFTKSKSSLTGESTIGASIGWTFARDHDFDNRFWVMGAGGLTVINPNSAFDDPGSEKSRNIPGATFCLGVGANISKTQAGIVFGWDFADPDWEFHGKPWLSFSVGFEFLKPKADGQNH
jgi:hypothetical protein